jgi:hypothetical protein
MDRKPLSQALERGVVLIDGAGLSAALSAVAFAGILAGVGGLGAAVVAVLLGGIAALWFTAFA